MQAALAQHPQLAAVMEQSAQNYASCLAQKQGPPADIYIIPTVFHIIHNNGEENITDAQVIQALAQANAQLSGQSGGADTRIRLVLAKVSPDGDCNTTAINRVQYDPPVIVDEITEVQVKNLSRWDPSRYLNVWVLRSLGGEIAGVAHFPETSTPETDGIAIRYKNLGTTGAADTNKVNTLVHELGHYLGLYHVWGKDELETGDPTCYNCDKGINSTINSTMYGDKVPDTAPCCTDLYDHQVYDCSPPKMYCVEVCYCDTALVDYPIENYMSYVHSCQNSFTQGQADRMHFYLDEWRSELWSPANLICTGIGAHHPDFRNDYVEWTTSNLPNGGEIFIHGDLVVPPGKTLVIHSGVKVRLCNNGRLVIRPNAWLLLNGTLTGMECSGNTWQGIRVEGAGPGQPQWPSGGVWPQGRLNCQNGSVIENAVTSIQNYGDNNLAGGIISCSGTTIRNCRTGVKFNEYLNFSPTNGQPRNYLASFTNTTFLTDNQYPHDEPFQAFVDMAGVNGIILKGCTFRNTRTIAGSDIADWGYGIRATDAGFSVIGLGLGSTYPPVDYQYSNFEGLGYGVYSARVLTNRPFKVERAGFRDCYVGLHNKGVSQSTLLFSQFYLGRVPDPSILQGQQCFQVNQMQECAQLGTLYEGIMSGFTYQQNTFQKTDGNENVANMVGTFFKGAAGSDANLVRKNTYTNLKYANIAQNINATSSPSIGLHYLCNINTGVNTADFAVLEGAVIRRDQGLLVDPFNQSFDAAGNRFSQVPNSIGFWNLGSGQINYYYNQAASVEDTIVSGPVFKIPAPPNTCPAFFCNPPCKSLEQLAELTTDYFTQKAGYEAARSGYQTALTGNNQALADQYELLMAAARHGMDTSSFLVTLHLLYDTLTFDGDSLRTWFVRMDNPAAQLQLAGDYMAKGHPNQAIAALQQASQLFDLDSEQAQDFSDLADIVALIGTQSVHGLDAATVAALDAYTTEDGRQATLLAQNIRAMYGHYYPPQYRLPGDIEERSGGDSRHQPTGQDAAIALTAAPNPSSGQVVFTLSGAKEGQTSRLTVTDLEGREVWRYVFAGETVQTTWRADVARGIYLYRLVFDDHTPAISGKVVLVK